MLGRTRRRIVRPMALVILATVVVSALEPVAGLARDGAVHHETAAQAATHSGFANADHAHESNGPGSPSDSDTDHEHGSNSDHCTHMHGIAHPALPSFDHFAAIIWLHDAGSRPVRSYVPTRGTPPPDA